MIFMASVILTTNSIRLFEFFAIQDILVIHFTTSGFTLRKEVPVSSRELSVLYRIENSEIKDPDLFRFFRKLYPEAEQIPFIPLNDIYFPRSPKKYEEADVQNLLRNKPSAEIYGRKK